MRDLTQELIDALQKRRQKGLETYGKPVDPDAESVEFWLNSLIEETLDASQYGLAALETVRKLRDRITELEDKLVIAHEELTTWKTIAQANGVR